MRDFIKTYEIWVFLLLAPIVNSLFVYGFHLHIVPGRLYMHGRFFLLLFFLIGLIWFTRGKEGVNDLIKPMKNWRIPLKWTLFASFFATIMCCLTLLLKAHYYGSDYSSVFKMNFSFLNPRFMFNLILWAFVGEVVWVSYAIRQLCKTLHPVYASIIVGLVWGLWWLPITKLNIGVVEDLTIWPLILSMMAVASMCTFIYGQTRSGICVWILQIMLNTSICVFPVTPSNGGVPTYITFSILYFINTMALMYFLNTKKKFKIRTEPSK